VHRAKAFDKQNAVKSELADLEIIRLAPEKAVAEEALPLERRAGLMSPAEVPPPFEAGDPVPRSRDTDLQRYAGFSPRLGALLSDSMILLPLGAFAFWGGAWYRLFSLYYLLPGAFFRLFYEVYLVRRFGGTPGKLTMGLRICKLDGEPVGCLSPCFPLYSK
jgi:hypothetical protein